MPFPPPSSGAVGRRQVSLNGFAAGPNIASAPFRWRLDGREIPYVSPDRQVMAADVTIKRDTLEIGTPRVLFSITSDSVNPSFDVTADGQRFLMLVSPDPKSAEPLTLVQNWVEGLR